jgi:hypothetical protein
MGNHYSPHDDAAADHRKRSRHRGELMKEAVSRHDSVLLDEWMHHMHARFRKVEQHVIGRDALKELDIIEKEIDGMFIITMNNGNL